MRRCLGQGSARWQHHASVGSPNHLSQPLTISHTRRASLGQSSLSAGASFPAGRPRAFLARLAMLCQYALARVILGRDFLGVKFSMKNSWNDAAEGKWASARTFRIADCHTMEYNIAIRNIGGASYLGRSRSLTMTLRGKLLLAQVPFLVALLSVGTLAVFGEVLQDTVADEVLTGQRASLRTLRGMARLLEEIDTVAFQWTQDGGRQAEEDGGLRRGELLARWETAVAVVASAPAEEARGLVGAGRALAVELDRFMKIGDPPSRGRPMPGRWSRPARARMRVATLEASREVASRPWKRRRAPGRALDGGDDRLRRRGPGPGPAHFIAAHQRLLRRWPSSTGGSDGSPAGSSGRGCRPGRDELATWPGRSTPWPIAWAPIIATPWTSWGWPANHPGRHQQPADPVWSSARKASWSI